MPGEAVLRVPLYPGLARGDRGAELLLPGVELHQGGEQDVLPRVPLHRLLILFGSAVPFLLCGVKFPHPHVPQRALGGLLLDVEVRAFRLFPILRRQVQVPEIRHRLQVPRLLLEVFLEVLLRPREFALHRVDFRQGPARVPRPRVDLEGPLQRLLRQRLLVFQQVRLRQEEIPRDEPGLLVDHGAELRHRPGPVLPQQVEVPLEQVGVHVPRAPLDHLVDVPARLVELLPHRVDPGQGDFRLEDVRGRRVLVEGQALLQHDDRVVGPAGVPVQVAQQEAHPVTFPVLPDPLPEHRFRVRHGAPGTVKRGGIQPAPLVGGFFREKGVEDLPPLRLPPRVPVEPRQGDPVAVIFRLELDDLAHLGGGFLRPSGRHVDVGQAAVHRQELLVGFQPLHQHPFRAAVLLVAGVRRGQEHVDVRLRDPSAQHPLEMGARLPVLLRGEEHGALEDLRILVPGVFPQDDFGPLHRLVALARADEQFPHLDLGGQQLRVELRGLAETLVGAAEVPPHHLRHPEHVVGVVELRVDLDGVLELEAGLDVIRVVVIRLPAVVELHLLLVRPAARRKQRDRDNESQNNVSGFHPSAPPKNRPHHATPFRKTTASAARVPTMTRSYRMRISASSTS